MIFGSVFGSGIWKAASRLHAATAKTTIARLENRTNLMDGVRVSIAFSQGCLEFRFRAEISTAQPPEGGRRTTTVVHQFTAS
jgi:hypothetical protein